MAPLKLAEYDLTLSATCVASSRVGTKISPVTKLPLLAAFLDPCSKNRVCSIGKANVAVLPEPVFAPAIKSLPASTLGIALA